MTARICCGVLCVLYSSTLPLFKCLSAYAFDAPYLVLYYASMTVICRVCFSDRWILDFVVVVVVPCFSGKTAFSLFADTIIARFVSTSFIDFYCEKNVPFRSGSECICLRAQVKDLTLHVYKTHGNHMR